MSLYGLGWAPSHSSNPMLSSGLPCLRVCHLNLFMSLYGLGISGFGGFLGGSRFLTLKGGGQRGARRVSGSSSWVFVDGAGGLEARRRSVSGSRGSGFLAVANGGRWRAAAKISENIEKSSHASLKQVNREARGLMTCVRGNRR